MPPSTTPRKRDPWVIGFAVSIVAVVWSLAALTFVVFNVVSDDEPTALAGEDEPPGGATALPDVRAGLTYAGTLPPRAGGLRLTAAAGGKTPDIEFKAASGDGGVPVRYFVPVAAVGAGVDALTAEELRRIWTGDIEDWAEVGGVAGRIVRVTADEADLQVYNAFLGLETLDLPGLEHFETYAALRGAFAFDAGMVAIVRLEDLGPEMVAIAIDGVDIARGRGDVASWPLSERVDVVALTERGREDVQGIRAAITASPPDAVTVVATGDVLQSRCSLAAIRATGDWGAALRGPVGEYLAAADLALSSLDGSIQGIGEPFGCIVMEYPNLTSPPEVVEALTLAGIDGMTLATNHAFDCGMGDCGSEALLESMKYLHAAGIKTVGGGKDLEEALAPAIFEVKGVKFGVLGFDDIAAEHIQATEDEPGTAPLDDSYENEWADPPEEPAFFKSAELLGVTRLQERIRALKQQVDVVIVQIQSGTEDTHTPSPRSIKALRAAADAGADLVVGNQAHWVQAAEVRGDSFVAYALGNFIFDQTWTPEHSQGYLLEATFHGKKLATVRLVPYQIEDKYRPVFVDGETRAKILRDVVEAGQSLPK